MARGYINKAYQIGVESTPGTPVAANKLLKSLSINLSPEVVSQQHPAHGSKFSGNSVVHKHWSSGAVEGPLSYNDIIYPLSTLFTPPTPTTPAGGTNSREWKFLPLVGGNETLKTLTVEAGDNTAAEIIAGVAVQGLTFTFAEDDITINGPAIGRKPTVGTLTGSPAALPQILASARDIDVYLHTALGALGVTLFANKLTHAKSGSFGIGEKLVPNWVHNTSFESYVDLVETRSELTADYLTEHNAQSRAIYAGLGDNSTQYLGIRITGSIIEGAIPYIFEIVSPVKVAAAAEEDADGVWGYRYTFSPEPSDGTDFWIRVVNTMTAL